MNGERPGSRFTYDHWMSTHGAVAGGLAISSLVLACRATTIDTSTTIGGGGADAASSGYGIGGAGGANPLCSNCHDGCCGSVKCPTMSPCECPHDPFCASAAAGGFGGMGGFEG